MPIGLRRDFDAARLRALARKSKDGAQARRLLALAEAEIHRENELVEVEMPGHAGIVRASPETWTDCRTEFA